MSRFRRSSTGSLCMQKNANKNIVRKMFSMRMVDMIPYAFIFSLVVLGFHFLSDGEFGALITLSSLLQCCSHVLVLLKITREKRVCGLSWKMFALYGLVYVSRLHATLRSQAYLPLDSSADWAYQACDFLSLLTICVILMFMFTWFRDTLEDEDDGFPASLIVIPMAILAYFIHSTNVSLRKPHKWLIDFSYSYSLYISALAVVPQLFLISRAKQVDTMTGHSLAVAFLARCCSLWWYYEFMGSFKQRGSPAVGYVMIFMECVSIVLLLDFVYCYLKSIIKRKKGPFRVHSFQV